MPIQIDSQEVNPDTTTFSSSERLFERKNGLYVPLPVADELTEGVSDLDKNKILRLETVPGLVELFVINEKSIRIKKAKLFYWSYLSPIIIRILADGKWLLPEVPSAPLMGYQYQRNDTVLISTNFPISKVHLRNLTIDGQVDLSMGKLGNSVVKEVFEYWGAKVLRAFLSVYGVQIVMRDKAPTVMELDSICKQISNLAGFVKCPIFHLPRENN